MTAISRADSSTSVADVMQHDLFEKCARAGFVVSGVLHLLIGYLGVRIATGGGNGEVDHSGALAELASKRGGLVALWVAAAALFAMSLWRLVETFLGRAADSESESMGFFDRFKAISLSAIYFALGMSALGFARGAGHLSSEQSAGLSARLMTSTPGKATLIVTGSIIAIVGLYHAYKGLSENFLDDLHETSDFVRHLGMVGYAAQGLVIMGAGLFFVIATINSEPEKATGLDGALKTLGAQPFGTVLLIVASLGIATYGCYNFAMARHMRM